MRSSGYSVAGPASHSETEALIRARLEYGTIFDRELVRPMKLCILKPSLSGSLLDKWHPL